MINPILLYSIFLFSMLYYQAKGVDNNMNQQAMDAILNRRSIRQYTSQPLSTGEIKQLLTAAMSAPSCMNCRDWSFIVVTDRDMMSERCDTYDPYCSRYGRNFFQPCYYNDW